ncbi:MULTISPECIES: hypothetical protein [Nostoc]|jgi:hypothetical protein|uniref:Uncharacterized protein n=2 Tax=Nostoc TaxID=1177 RepID=A0ABR8IEG9_9NOSO|nr:MULTISPECIES: hypothetical protein [Nostoc]MBD2564101.1 hypothetical protein [Nostoc linckia FACHB-391]MBD2649822.1 hypothetical protein [Nostoc foliaceum FACHB-393]
MKKIWTFWEFDHTLGSAVRVISTPLGLEIFAEDVFQIIAPELNNEKVVPLHIQSRERHVVIGEQVTIVKTLNSGAIYNLKGIVEEQMINNFTQWIRSNVLPIFQKDFFLEN